MTWIILLLFISYAVVVLLLLDGWQKAKEQHHVLNKDVLQFLSVVIPVRNEEEAIDRLLNDLVNQHYPKDKFEIIVVNDHSNDNTSQVVGKKIDNATNLRIVVNEGQGKKLAITTGVRLSKGEIIVTTDADCWVGTNWLQTISDSFYNEKIKMVFGPVKIQNENSFFSKLQAIEFSSLIGSGAATIMLEIPTMCNGANLAFRKDTFAEVDGYEGNTHIASGDDEFLMRKIFKKYPEGIRFNNSQESIVSTKPQRTLSEFIDQRIRWAGKWKFHNDLKSKLLAVYIFLFQLSVLILPVLVMRGHLSPLTAVIFLLVKAILELIFLRSVTSWLGVKWDWLSFIALQFIYPLYVLGIGLSSSFLKPIWKGRK
jgi:biofilm PGA synthesis N-glycosyltransferase PgaC